VGFASVSFRPIAAINWGEHTLLMERMGLSRTTKGLLYGISATYLVCIAAQFLGPYPDLIYSNAFGVAVLLFLSVAVALHIAVALSVQTLRAAMYSVGSIAILAALVLIGLMKLTGDSL